MGVLPHFDTPKHASVIIQYSITPFSAYELYNTFHVLEFVCPYEFASVLLSLNLYSQASYLSPADVSMADVNSHANDLVDNGGWYSGKAATDMRYDNLHVTLLFVNITHCHCNTQCYSYIGPVYWTGLPWYPLDKIIG